MFKRSIATLAVTAGLLAAAAPASAGAFVGNSIDALINTAGQSAVISPADAVHGHRAL